MYQKIDALNDFEELEAFKTETIDQYGRLPQEVDALFEKRKLDILVNDSSVDSYKELNGKHQITFSEQFSQSVDGVKLFKLFSDISKDIDLRYTNNRIIATLPKSNDSLKTVIRMIIDSKEAVRHAD